MSIEATAETLTLDLSREQIEQQTTPAGMALAAFTMVRANGVHLGRLAQMTVTAPSETIRHFVAAHGLHGLRREIAAPARIIIGMTARQISVRLDGLPQKRLLPYRTDTLLRQDMYARLFDYAPLRVDLPSIEIQPVDGVVWLRGHVASGGALRDRTKNPGLASISVSLGPSRRDVCAEASGCPQLYVHVLKFVCTVFSNSYENPLSPASVASCYNHTWRLGISSELSPAIMAPHTAAGRSAWRLRLTRI